MIHFFGKKKKKMNNRVCKYIYNNKYASEQALFNSRCMQLKSKEKKKMYII